MWDATHLQTGREKLASLFWIEYSQKGFDPHKEEWVCCLKCKKPLSIVTPHKKNINGRATQIPSFFKYKNIAEGLCAYESDEHWKIKQFIASLIQNNELVIKIGQRRVPIKEIDLTNVSIVGRCEQQRTDGCINSIKREADALAEFKLFHKELGQGIAFEVQLSAITQEQKNKRTDDWISMGYSVCWVSEDILDIENKCLTTNEISITHPYYLEFIRLMRKEFDKTTRHITTQITDFNTKVDESVKKLECNINEKVARLESKLDAYEFRMEDRLTQLQKLEEMYKTQTQRCETCKHGRPDKDIMKSLTGLWCCWRLWPDKKRPTKHDARDKCIYWEQQK